MSADMVLPLLLLLATLAVVVLRNPGRFSNEPRERLGRLALIWIGIFVVGTLLVGMVL